MNDDLKVLLLGVLGHVLAMVLTAGFFLIGLSWLVGQLDPSRNKKKQQAKAIMAKLKISTNVQVYFVT